MNLEDPLSLVSEVFERTSGNTCGSCFWSSLKESRGLLSLFLKWFERASGYCDQAQVGSVGPSRKKLSLKALNSTSFQSIKNLDSDTPVLVYHGYWRLWKISDFHGSTRHGWPTSLPIPALFAEKPGTLELVDDGSPFGKSLRAFMWTRCG